MICKHRGIRSTGLAGEILCCLMLAWGNPAGAASQLAADPLAGWKLTLPVDNNGDGKADEVKDLTAYEHLPWFRRIQGGLVFRVPAGGARTSSTTAYARSELRQLDPDGRPAAWECLAGEHSLHLRQRLLHTTTAKPEATLGQIHDARNDNLMIRYSGPSNAGGKHDIGRIEVLVNNGAQHDDLDTAYQLGQTMQIDITLRAGTVEVFYLNQDTGVSQRVTRVLEPAAIVGACYFKAGLYIQACSRDDLQGRPNQVCLHKGWPANRYDAPDAWAESEISELRAE